MENPRAIGDILPAATRVGQQVAQHLAGWGQGNLGQACRQRVRPKSTRGRQCCRIWVLGMSAGLSIAGPIQFCR
jgi:hypothetical protein